MDINTLKINAAKGALETVLGVKANDKVLIVTDRFTRKEAEAFRIASEDIGCSVITYIISEDERPLKEIPGDLLNLLKRKTIVLNIFRALSEEIPFRIKWIFESEKTKRIRMGHMPGFTGGMLNRMANVDFSKMRTTADRMLKFLEGAESLHITTSKGTDLSIGVKGRKFRHDILIKKGGTGNIPCGEVYCAPVENKTNGTVVFDVSIGDIGKLKTPVEVKIENGRIKSVRSKDGKLVRQIKKLTGRKIYANTIGELGIGVNSGVKITGNMLEDEKMSGTAHIAFGNNEDFGGKNKAKIHRDYLFGNPTIEVVYSDGRKKILMKNGKLIFNK